MEPLGAERTTRATMVYDRLRREILTGKFRPSEKLLIDAIANTYEVGNNAVREALSRLAAERLVDRHERRGYSAPAMGLDAWRTLVKTRIWVETLALRESMENRTDSWEENIVVAFHRLSKIGGKGEFTQAIPEWNIEHRNFHSALIANCDSHWLMEFCEQLADQAGRYIYISNLYRVSPRNGNAEHEELMKVALAGDVEKAQAVLTEHLKKTLISIEQIFQSDEAFAGYTLDADT